MSVSHKVINRRKFLMLSATAGASSLLAACAAPAQPPPATEVAPAATEAPAAVSATEAPAATPVPAATPTVVTQTASEFSGTGGLNLPLSKDPLKLKGFSTSLYAPAPGIKSLSDQIFFQEAAKRTNVSFDWQMAAEDSQAPIDLIMASGDLPDVFIGISPNQAVDYGQQGALAPLNDLIEKFAPNFSKLLQDVPEIKGQLTAPDGKIYFFPRALLEPQTRNFSGFIIRQDWLDEVGMQIPQTTDELYAVLKAFKEKDKNRYPLTWDPYPLIWAFGVGGAGGANNTDFYRVDKQVKFAPIEEGYQQGLEYIAKLYKEGLLDPEYNTAMTQPEFLKERWLKGISGVQLGYAGSHLSAFASAMKDVVPEAKLVPMLPPAGPTGVRENLSVHNVIDAGQGGAIAASSKHQEVLAQFFDYFYSPEGKLLFFWGTEGDTFAFDKEGIPQYTDKVVKNDLKLSVGEWVWNYISPDWFGPMVYPAQAYLQSVTPEAQAGLALWGQLETKLKLPVLHFTKEENDTIRAKMTDINTLLAEKRSKFVDGSEPLDGWPDLVKQIESLGIADVTKIHQDAYNRFLAA